MSGYFKTFKDKDEDKNKSNKIMSSRIDDDKLLEKYKTILMKIGDLQNINFYTLPVYGDSYIKTKIKTHDNKVFTNFCGLFVQEDGVE